MMSRVVAYDLFSIIILQSFKIIHLHMNNLKQIIHELLIDPPFKLLKAGEYPFENVSDL